MTRIIAAAAAEAYSTKLLPPVSAGLRALHLLNGSVEKAARNYALGHPDGRVVGAPVVGAGFVNLTGLVNYIQTQLEEALEGTYFVAARATSAMEAGASRPMLFGTYLSEAAAGGGATFGVSLTLQSSTSVNANAGRGTSTGDDSAANTSITSPATTAWALYCLTVANAGATTLRDLTNNLQSQVSPGTPRFRSRGLMRIGSGYSTFGGSADQAIYAEYSRVLSADEIATQAAWIRAYLASQGVTV